jgi:polyisoprenoid-binding protein YceI
MVKMETEPVQAAPKRRVGRWIALGGAVVLAAGVAGVFWFFSGDAPDEADLTETAAAVTGSSTPTDDTTVAEEPTTDGASGATGIEGAWTVDTSVGEFSVTENTTATFAGFRIEEVLNSIGSTTAVGRTPVISGTMTVEGTTVTGGEFVVDLTAIVSDESRRESRIQDALGTAANPEATFVLTEPIELGDAAAAGDPVQVTAVGDLTINGVTNRVEMLLEAQLVDGMILVVGSTDIVFADYGVTVPSAPMVLSVEDHGTLEVQLWLSQ